MTRQLEKRRRRERAAGIALGFLGVGVLIIALFALRSPNGHGHVAAKGTTTTKPPAKSTPKSPSTSPSSSPATKTPTTTPTKTPTASTSKPATGRLPLVVLNNTGVVGLADQAKARFEAGGWSVTSTGNLINNIVSTCAYYDPAVAGAQAAAQALQTEFPTIKRVVPKFAELPSGPIVVVLTSDYS
ncbi:MAG: LytR cell envelope-related transcriptional attenuator [Pseudonocardiales bacterium]|nr:LytR cell envelope-related transcriptional attenuator [Pseudonocardiales bacterium]